MNTINLKFRCVIEFCINDGVVTITHNFLCVVWNFSNVVLAHLFALAHSRSHSLTLRYSLFSAMAKEFN